MPDVSSQLWTDRYAPQTLKEVCGNKGQVEKLQQWLHDWCVLPDLDYTTRLNMTSVRQVIKPQIWVQEAREEWHERFPRRPHHRSSRDR